MSQIFIKMKRIAILTLLFMLPSCINSSNNTIKQKGNQECKPASEAQAESQQSRDNAILFTNKAEVNVYLETSGSMNGYVDQGKSQFQQVIFDYLSNIQNSGLFSEMNLNYITDKITPKGKDVDPFINSLTSKGIMSASGSKATTDIASLLTTILDNTNDNQISIFISDCIFSPGSVTKPEAYLENQKIAIRNATKSFIDKNEFAGCTVYRFMSDFNGSYFDNKNRANRISMSRPFYIWVFGSVANLAAIKLSIPDDKFMGATVANTWTIFKGNLSEYNGLNDYGLLQPSPTNGVYRWKSRNEIANIRKSGDEFAFTFGVDLKLQVLLYGEEYAMDIDNYCQLVDKQSEKVLRGRFRQNNIKAAKYSHDISVLSDKPFDRGAICIAFDGKVPQWVYECSDMDDSVLNDSNCSKTYGFQYMCEGIYAGFHSNNSKNITALYEFEIK